MLLRKAAFSLVSKNAVTVSAASALLSSLNALITELTQSSTLSEILIALQPLPHLRPNSRISEAVLSSLSFKSYFYNYLDLYCPDSSGNYLPNCSDHLRDHQVRAILRCWGHWRYTNPGCVRSGSLHHFLLLHLSLLRRDWCYLYHLHSRRGRWRTTQWFLSSGTQGLHRWGPKIIAHNQQVISHTIINIITIK